MKIKAMIAEDERLVREELAYLLQLESDFILCPNAENGQQLIKLANQYNPDVIFLDIEMPKLSGIDVAKQLIEAAHHNNQQCPIFVFTTAYDEYAVQAFALEATDYLLKPFDTSRFKEALARIRKKMEQGHAPPPKQHTNKLLIEDGEKMHVVAPGLIYFAARDERMIEIHTENEIIKTKMSLQELEEKLSGYPFYRSHRSYLVNLDYIQEIVPWFNGAYNIILKNKKNIQIPVSRSSAKQLFEILQK